MAIFIFFYFCLALFYVLVILWLQLILFKLFHWLTFFLGGGFHLIFILYCIAYLFQLTKLFVLVLLLVLV